MLGGDLLSLFVEPLEGLDLSPPDAPRLRAAFASSDFYCPPEDEIRLEAERAIRGHINIFHIPTALKADIYFAGDDWLHRWALPRCHRLEVESRSIRLAPPEYVIVRKLSFYREGGSSKHVRDVRALVAARRPELDLGALRVLAAREGVLDIWKELFGEE